MQSTFATDSASLPHISKTRIDVSIGQWPVDSFFILFLAMMATLLRSDLSSGFLHFAYPRRFNSCFVSFSIEGERIYVWEGKKLTLWIVNRRTTDSAIGGL